jgi:hypothetical protein
LRLKDNAAARGLTVTAVVDEIGSRLNGECKNLIKLLLTRASGLSWWSTANAWHASAWST